jgi:hypothetical protein
MDEMAPNRYDHALREGAWGQNKKSRRATPKQPGRNQEHHKLPAGAPRAGLNLTQLDSESVSVQGIRGAQGRADAHPCKPSSGSTIQAPGLGLCYLRTRGQAACAAQITTDVVKDLIFGFLYFFFAIYKYTHPLKTVNLNFRLLG